MRSITFKQGKAQEGIRIKWLAGESFGILLGWKDGFEPRPDEDQLRPVLLNHMNHPDVKQGRIFSVSPDVAWIKGRGNRQIPVISRPINGGPNKRRNNKTLVRINTFYPYFNDSQPNHFGGNWSVTKGNPKTIASAFGGEGKSAWTDDLVIMSPGDIICITYYRQEISSFFLAYEPSAKGGSRVVCHDSIYFTKMLNEGRTRRGREEKRIEREKRRAEKEGRILLFR